MNYIYVFIDKITGNIGDPFISSNDQAVIRSMSISARATNHPFFRDIEVYCIGEFDPDNLPMIRGYDSKRYVCKGDDFVAVAEDKEVKND